MPLYSVTLLLWRTHLFTQNVYGMFWVMVRDFEDEREAMNFS